jgi:hypothetical protein
MYPAAITMRVLSPISGRGGSWLSLLTLSTFTAVSASTLGCGGDDDGDAEVGDDGSLACDVPQLFETRCAGDSCHGGGDSSAAGLDLLSPGVEERISGATGQSCGGIVADPANPENSILYEKLGEAPECGARMPLATEPLSEDEITCVRDWISGLLPPTTGDCANCMCEPGTSEDCYAGPEPTANVGICQTGTHTCQTSGLGYGACEGESLPSIERCMTDEDENCDGVTPDCAEIWSVGFGSPVSQVMRSAMSDAEGNVFGFGDFEGTVDFGGPEDLEAIADKSDLVLVKLDHFGTPLWSKSWGDSSNQYATEMIVDPEGNVILLGRIYGTVDFGGSELVSGGAGDLLVVKLDNDGEHVWSRVFGDKDPDRAERVAVDAEGDVIVTGTFTTEMDFGGPEPLLSAGMRDAFVVELDGQTGAYIAALQIGGAGDDYGFGVDATADGGLVVAGRFAGSIELGGGLTSEGELDIYFARLDSSLLPVWAQSFGSVGIDEPHDVAVQQNGDIVLIGGFSDTVDFGGGGLVSAGARDIFLATFDDAGEHVWSNGYGDSTDQFGGSFELNSSLTLAVDDEDGTIYMAGYLLGAVDFDGQIFDAAGDTNADAFYTVFDAGGTFVTGQYYGAGGTEIMHDINVASDGLIVLAGRTLGSRIDFEDAGTVLGWGDADAFIAKIQP